MTATSSVATHETMTEADTLHEECGVFGVWAPGRDVARLTYFGLFAYNIVVKNQRVLLWEMAPPFLSAKTLAL